LTPGIVEVFIKAPFAARHFYRGSSTVSRILKVAARRKMAYD